MVLNDSHYSATTNNNGHFTNWQFLAFKRYHMALAGTLNLGTSTWFYTGITAHLVIYWALPWCRILGHIYTNQALSTSVLGTRSRTKTTVHSFNVELQMRLVYLTLKNCSSMVRGVLAALSEYKVILFNFSKNWIIMKKVLVDSLFSQNI